MAVTFEDFKFNRQILNAIADAGYTEATPIQQKAIPPILNGQDVMGIAQTGTGKTAAYVLPILMKLKYAQGDHARALIIAPTRELAMQIEENIKAFAANTDLRVVVLSLPAALSCGRGLLLRSPLDGFFATEQAERLTCVIGSLSELAAPTQ